MEPVHGTLPPVTWLFDSLGLRGNNAGIDMASAQDDPKEMRREVP